MGDTCVGRKLRITAAVVAREGVRGRDMRPVQKPLPEVASAASSIRSRRASAPFGLAEPALGWIEQAKVNRSVTHQPAVGHFVDADCFTDQRVADVDRATRPPDLPGVADLPHLIRVRVRGCLKTPGIGSRRGCVATDRRLLAKVRTAVSAPLVEAGDEAHAPLAEGGEVRLVREPGGWKIAGLGED